MVPPILILCGVLGVALAVLARRLARWSLAAVLAVLLVAPTGFAAATWGAPAQGTFPVAGPWGAPGFGGLGLAPKELPEYRGLLRYLDRHHPTRRFSVLTVSSVTAAPLILMGSHAAALAGYSGTDPALSAGGLAHLVERHQARYVLLGGPYSSRGGNGATAATLAGLPLHPPPTSGALSTTTSTASCSTTAPGGLRSSGRHRSSGGDVEAAPEGALEEVALAPAAHRGTAARRRRR